MNSSGLLVCEGREGIYIGGLELEKSPELDDFVRKRVGYGQFSQNLLVGGKTRLRFFDGREFQFVEEDVSELFWGVDVEGFSGKLIDLFHQLVETGLKLPG